MKKADEAEADNSEEDDNVFDVSRIRAVAA